MSSSMRPVVRASAFVTKEIAEVLRQPSLLVILILAPFAILLVFGLALADEDPPLRTVFVSPDDPRLAEEVEEFAAEQEGRLVVEGVVDDEDAALTQLRRGDVELVIVFPDEPQSQIRDGEQAVVEMHHDQIDPVETRAVVIYNRLAVNELNRQLLVNALEEGEQYQDVASEVADDEEGPLLADSDLEPEVLVSPFRGEARPLQGNTVGMAAFYAPAVVIVLLQHLMVTFLGLSLVRERQLGVQELYRLAPLQPGELIAGKYLGHGLIGAVVLGGLTAALVAGMGVPMLGSWLTLAGVFALTLAACAALGMVLALLARTDSQAVQYAMMLLLATVFLGGFLVSIERFVPALRWVSWLVPATHGIDAARDVMLRGRLDEPLHLVALAVMAVVLTAVAWWLTRRRLHRVGQRAHREEPSEWSEPPQPPGSPEWGNTPTSTLPPAPSARRAPSGAPMPSGSSTSSGSAAPSAP